MKFYLTNTFTPRMLPHSMRVDIDLLSEEEFSFLVKCLPFTSAISHENTAAQLSHFFEKEIPFNRVNLTLQEGDVVLAVIPNFRAGQAREFSKEELEKGFSFYRIKCKPLTERRSQ